MSGVAAIAVGAAIGLIAVPAMGAAAPLTPAMRPVVRRHIAGLDGVFLRDLAGFREVHVFQRSNPDSASFFVGALVRGRWLPAHDPSARDGGAFSELTQAALRSRGWERATPSRRRALALAWLRVGLPSGETVEEDLDHPGHGPTVTTHGRSVTVTAWIDDRHETRSGLRTHIAEAPTSFRFGPDGWLEIDPG